MAAPGDVAVEELPAEALGRLVGELLGEVARLREENAAPREEVARLRGLSGRAKIKPSGMERATAAEGERPQGGTKGAAKATELVVHEGSTSSPWRRRPARGSRAMRTSSSGSCGWRRG